MPKFDPMSVIADPVSLGPSGYRLIQINDNGVIKSIQVPIYEEFESSASRSAQANSATALPSDSFPRSSGTSALDNHRQVNGPVHQSVTTKEASRQLQLNNNKPDFQALPRQDSASGRLGMTWSNKHPPLPKSSVASTGSFSNRNVKARPRGFVYEKAQKHTITVGPNTFHSTVGIMHSPEGGAAVSRNRDQGGCDVNVSDAQAVRTSSNTAPSECIGKPITSSQQLNGRTLGNSSMFRNVSESDKRVISESIIVTNATLISTNSVSSSQASSTPQSLAPKERNTVSSCIVISDDEDESDSPKKMGSVTAKLSNDSSIGQILLSVQGSNEPNVAAKRPWRPNNIMNSSSNNVNIRPSVSHPVVLSRPLQAVPLQKNQQEPLPNTVAVQIPISAAQIVGQTQPNNVTLLPVQNGPHQHPGISGIQPYKSILPRNLTLAPQMTGQSAISSVQNVLYQQPSIQGVQSCNLVPRPIMTPVISSNSHNNIPLSLPQNQAPLLQKFPTLVHAVTGSPMPTMVPQTLPPSVPSVKATDSGPAPTMFKLILPEQLINVFSPNGQVTSNTASIPKRPVSIAPNISANSLVSSHSATPISNVFYSALSQSVAVIPNATTSPMSKSAIHTMDTTKSATPQSATRLMTASSSVNSLAVVNATNTTPSAPTLPTTSSAMEASKSATPQSATPLMTASSSVNSLAVVYATNTTPSAPTLPATSTATDASKSATLQSATPKMNETRSVTTEAFSCAVDTPPAAPSQSRTPFTDTPLSTISQPAAFITDVTDSVISQTSSVLENPDLTARTTSVLAVASNVDKEESPNATPKVVTNDATIDDSALADLLKSASTSSIPKDSDSHACQTSSENDCTIACRDLWQTEKDLFKVFNVDKFVTISLGDRVSVPGTRDEIGEDLMGLFSDDQPPSDESSGDEWGSNQQKKARSRGRGRKAKRHRMSSDCESDFEPSKPKKKKRKRKKMVICSDSEDGN